MSKSIAKPVQKHPERTTHTTVVNVRSIPNVQRARPDYVFEPTTWPVSLQMLTLLGALALMYIAQYQVYRNGDYAELEVPLILFGLGLGTFFLLLNGKILTSDSSIAIPLRIQRVRLRIPWLLISLTLIGIEAALTVAKPQRAHLYVHLLLWFLSMVAFVFALSPLKGDLATTNLKRLTKLDYWLIVGLFLGAFAVRVIQINSVPDIMDNDETLFANEGASFIRENFLITPFEPGIHSHPRMYQAMIGLSIELFGTTLLGARLPSVLLGTMTVCAVYLLGLELRDRWTGLIAALFILTWPYAIQFSRLAMNQPADPLFATLAFYFLLRGLRRGAVIDYALCGFMLGIAQLFYLGGRLAPLVVIAYLLFLWFTNRALIQRQWRLLLVIPFAFTLASFPQHFYLFYYQQPLTTRANPFILLEGQLQNNIEHGTVISYLTEQVKKSFLAFNVLPDRSGWYGRSSNMVGLFGGPMLIFGIIMSLLTIWKHPKWSLPLGWALAVVFAGGVFTISPPQYQRLFAGATAFALLVEFGISTVALAITRIQNRPDLERVIALNLAVLVSVCNLGFYTFVYVPEADYFATLVNWQTNQVGREMVKAYDSGRQVVIVGGFMQTVQKGLVIEYFMSGRSFIDGEQPVAEWKSQVEAGKPTTFIISIERQSELSELMRVFPGGQLREVALRKDGSRAYFLYEAPA